MTLGDIIKAYRNAHDYSMGDFAKLSGLSKPYISMLERDINSSTGKPIIPSVPTLQAVAKVMGISLDVLMKQIDDEQLISVSEDETPYYLNPETAKLAQEIYENPQYRVLFDASRKLKPESIKEIMKFIKYQKAKENGEDD
jgi:Predicted transcriptional regulators